MKNILRAIMSLLLFVACTTTEESPSSVPNGGNESVTPSITLEHNYLNFDEHADVQTISFSSTMDWTAELINDRADGWCSISATSGSAGSREIDVTVTENTSTDDRTASVIIKSGAISKTVRISQKQRDALTVTSSTFEIEGTSGKIYIEVKANVDFEYTINGSAAEWITPIETRAMKTTTLGFNIAENKTMQRREGTITIHSGDLSETVTVYQKDHGEAIIISQKEYVVSDTGEDIAVEVTSNVDVEIEMPGVDWITRNTSRAVSTNTYYFTIAENTSYDQREAYITFKNTEKKISERVKVSQVQKDAIVLAAEQYNVTSEGEQITIELGHNVDFEYEIIGDWITHVETRALQTNYLVFEVASNASYDSREGSVIFTANNGSLTQVAKIFQAQKDAIIISDNDIVVSDASQQISFDVETNIDFSVIDPDVDWLHPIVTRGLTTHTLTYTVDENTTYDSREAQIVVKNNATNITQTVTVTQAQKDAIVLAKSEYNVSSEGKQIEIELGHNVDFEYEIIGDWITHVETRALQTNYLVFEVASNASYDSREGSVIFTANNGSLTQVAKIFQAQKDAIIISDNDIVVSDASQQISFDVETNIDFSVIDPDVDWLHPVVTRGLTTHTLTYTVDENTTYDSREAQIVVKNNATNITQTVTVTQAQKDAIVLAKSEYEIELEGGALDFDIQTNVEVSVSISEDAQSWITQVVTRGLETRTLYFDIAPYDGDATREGTITISGGNAMQTINICQFSWQTLEDNKIYYTSSDGQIVEPYSATSWGDKTSIISNTYENGQGVIVFSRNLTEIGSWAFQDNGNKFTSITLPKTLKKIGYQAFLSCSQLTEIEIPNSVTSIGTHAFAYCKALTEVTLGENLETIGDTAFVGCTALTNITIPDKVKSIGSEAFKSCTNLTEVTLGSGLETISESAFLYCGKLESITIPDSVTSIGQSAFQDCLSLNSVTFGKGLETIGESAFAVCNSLTSITIPDNVKSLGNNAFNSCKKLVEVNIGNGVKTIGSEAFRNCEKLAEIYLGSGLETIEWGAFANNPSLTRITIPNNVKKIGSDAFYYCDALTSITIPNSVKAIEDSTFNACVKLAEVNIGDGVETIGEYAFYACALTSINIPNSVKTIKGGAFQECRKLATVTFGSGLETIGDRAFNNCESLTQITIPNSVKTIGGGAFYDCPNLREVSLGNSLEVIPGNAFGNCHALTSITIPDSVTYIGEGAFENCSSLTSITIPDNVKIIKNHTFNGCSNLAEVTIGEGVETIGSYAFNDCTSLTTVTLGSGLETINELAFHMCISLTSINIPDNVKTIGGHAFDNCYSLATVTLGNSLESIGDRAFNDCAMTNITIPNSVKTIGSFAFLDCPNLKEVSLGNSLEVIGDAAFENCYELTAISIPDNTKSIGHGAFCGCRNLTTLDLGNGVETIYNQAFDGCIALNSVTIPQSVVEIVGNPFTRCSGIKAFYGKFASEDNSTLFKDNVIIAIANYENITNYTIPNGITKIANSLFYGWENLKSVTIPNGVTEIGDNAFYDCVNLQTINIPEGITTIKGGTFHGCGNLKQIILPNSLTKIESCAFEWTGLTEITIPDSVTEIGGSVFAGCEYLSAFNSKLASADKRSLIINNELVAFAYAGATEYNIPEGVTTLKHMSFAWIIISPMATISLPNSLTTIEAGAFYDCRTISEITIPENVTYIGGFSMENLSKIYCKATTPPTLDGDIFGDSQASSKTIYVPTVLVETYKNATGWSNYAHLIVGYDF